MCKVFTKNWAIFIKNSKGQYGSLFYWSQIYQWLISDKIEYFSIKCLCCYEYYNIDVTKRSYYRVILHLSCKIYKKTFQICSSIKVKPSVKYEHLLLNLYFLLRPFLYGCTKNSYIAFEFRIFGMHIEVAPNV